MDGGGEYECEVKGFRYFMGFVHNPTPLYAYESNGLAERLNRTRQHCYNALCTS